MTRKQESQSSIALAEGRREQRWAPAKPDKVTVAPALPCRVVVDTDSERCLQKK